MGEADTAVFRSQLLDRRRRLESASRTMPESADLVRLLQEIDSALERMDQGTYGLCDTCHEAIEENRLMADPLTRLCLDHLNAVQRRALEEDLDLALRIQTALLPDRNLRTRDWEACYHYEPAGLVSGDYCDLVSSGDSLFFLTGDVAGKGVAASLLMSHLHAIFRSLLSVGMPVTELIGRANRVFCESTMPSSYATLICGRATASGEAEICNAGLCSPLLVRAGGIMTLEATGLPLGMFRQAQYSSHRIHLEPGDSLVLYTDGLTEVRNPADDEYGLDRLTDMLARSHGKSAQVIANTCLEDLRSFLAGAPKTDDLTILVIQHS